ncbi:HAD hydrolase family protein [Georgenia sp. Z1344]|uniref:HAD hydrolase family protein n=1 Tax=Georgenia sp. Z1344 TaxID=3416706 RepID=UPI003CE726CE
MVAPDLLRTVRAVSLDVDGTISGDDHQVAPRTIEAVGRIVELGVPVFLLTDRARANTLGLARDLGLTNIVTSDNGAVLLDPVTGEDVAVRPMDPAHVRALVELAAELALDITWWTTAAIYVEREGAAADLLRQLNGDLVQVGDTADLPDAVTKVMFFGTREQLDAVDGAVRSRFPDTTRSMDTFFEFVDSAATKWNALTEMLARHEMGAEHCLGMGDGGNDVEWLGRIGVPIAMGNARAEVKEVAIDVTATNAEHGVALVLEALADELTNAPTAVSDD